MDKIEKVKQKIEELKSKLIRGACSSQIAMETLCKEEAYNEVLSIIDSMQEKPKHRFNVGDKVQSASGKIAKIESVDTDKYWCVSERGMTIPFKYQDKWELVKEPVSEDLEEAADNALSNVLNTHEIVNVRSCLEMFRFGANWQKKRDYIPLSDDINEVARQICNKVLNCEIDYMEDDVVLSDEEECVKAGIRWQIQKESIPSKDLLEELINNLSKRYPEISFAKLSRIAVRVAKWQKEHLWKPANGDDLPEIDREVIALTQPYPNDEHLRVVFAHRPNKYAKFWNSTLGEEQVVEIEGYDKGGWNIPDVKFWLDVELLKEIKL